MTKIELGREPKQHDGNPLQVAAFYKFVAIDDVGLLQQQLALYCCARGIKGTIILAAEGINATVAASEQAVSELLATLRSDARFSDLQVKFSTATSPPFRRMKVKVKPEIVTLGLPEVAAAERTGKRISASSWNELISDPSTLVIDTRNDYEVLVGTFENAVNPRTRNFSEFPNFVEQNLGSDRSRTIAMFCTGGIRCEKASAYLLSMGFENVFQLDGGILRYLEDVPVEDSLWRGECFVFDERVALEHGVREGKHKLCTECGVPVKAEAADGLCELCSENEKSRT